MKEKKALFIELKKDIRKLIDDYLLEAGISPSDFAFALGYLSRGFSKDETANDQFKFINQIYFFTGVYYAKTTSDFKFEKISIKDRDKIAAEIKQKISEKQEQIKNKVQPVYFG